MSNPFQHEKRRRLTPLQRAELFARAGGNCQQCTRKIPHSDDWDVGEWDADHEIALSRGGTNDDENFRVLCSWCHDEKSSDDRTQAAKSKRIYAQHVVPKRFTRSRSWGRR
jgi:5-methylcytosine-specific restriction endonuclease McrA